MATSALAGRLEKEAADLKRPFNRDFWVESGEYFALALDPDGDKVDVVRVEQRPSALERHRRQVQGEGCRRALLGGSSETTGETA